MSQSKSGSGITDRCVISIPDSTKIREGDSLLEMNKRIEILGEKIDMLSSEISELKAAFEDLSRIKEFLPLNIKYCDKHKGEIFYG